MIVVDTSVWVASFRDPKGTTAAMLKSLIDADEACLALPVHSNSVRDSRAPSGLNSVKPSRPCPSRAQ